MTVIAYANGVMAADTMLNAGNRQSRASKLFRITTGPLQGGVVGGCGIWSRAYAAAQYVAAGGSLDGKDGPGLEGSSLLIASPDGVLYVADDEWPAFPTLDKVAAIGCGSDAAVMAMTLGKTAVEAVALVTQQDVFCADPVQSMDVYTAPEYPGVTTHVAEQARGRKRAR